VGLRKVSTGCFQSQIREKKNLKAEFFSLFKMIEETDYFYNLKFNYLAHTYNPSYLGG
jgi:hypothetical protein